MRSHHIAFFLLGVVFNATTLANLYPELAHSHVSPELIDIDVKQTKFIESAEPLTFPTSVDEIFDVKNTGKSVDVVRVKHHPIGLAGTVKGGVLGDNVYEYFKSKFYWNDNTTELGTAHRINGKTGNRLEVLAYYQNRKYQLYEEALKHSDGIVQVLGKIYVFDAVPPNPLFDTFEHLSKKIRKPGKHVLTKSSSTFIWFVCYPLHTAYYAYRGTYTDDDTGIAYPSTTIELSPNAANYISYRQFKKSFGAFENCDGKPMSNVAPRCSQGDTVVIKSEKVAILNF